MLLMAALSSGVKTVRNRYATLLRAIRHTLQRMVVAETLNEYHRNVLHEYWPPASASPNNNGENNAATVKNATENIET